MLFKHLLIAKLIVEIGLTMSMTPSEKAELSYVSRNWHKTQVFIFYDKEHSLDQVADCLGTILSPRFILTTAMCIALDIYKLQHAVITVLGTDSYKTLTPDQTNKIDTYRVEKFTIHPDLSPPERIFPDLAILKLIKDIRFILNMINHKMVESDPLDNPGTYLLKYRALIPKQPHDIQFFQIITVTYLTGQRRGSLIRLRSRF